MKRQVTKAKNDRIIKVFMFLAVFVFSLSRFDAAWASEESHTEREFNEVLDDILDEFGYDLKTNQVALSANLALRKINLSENIPTSYEKYMETIVSERIRQFSQTKVVHCPTCRVKQSIVKNGRVTVIMPINNKRALDELSREYGIEAWLDVGLIYQETSLIVAFNLFDAKTKELLWSKVYNSESLYQRFPQGVPEPEADRGKAEAEQQKEKSNYVVGLAIGWALVPNVNGRSGMIAASLRFAEAFNKLRSEVGVQFIPIVATSSVLPRGKTEDDVDLEESNKVTRNEEKEVVKSFDYGLGVFGSYHHNFKTSEEARDSIRFGPNLSAGFIVASGYLSFTGLAGINVRMGRTLFADLSALYSAPTTITLNDDYSFKTQGGAGALATFGILF